MILGSSSLDYSLESVIPHGPSVTQMKMSKRDNRVWREYEQIFREAQAEEIIFLLQKGFSLFQTYLQTNIS